HLRPERGIVLGPLLRGDQAAGRRGHPRGVAERRGSVQRRGETGCARGISTSWAPFCESGSALNGRKASEIRLKYDHSEATAATNPSRRLAAGALVFPSMNLFAASGVDLPRAGAGPRRPPAPRGLKLPLFAYKVVAAARGRLAFAPTPAQAEI